MAKNKVKVDVEVTDKGTLKQVGGKAKKAAKDMDELGNRSGTVDRNLKGVAGASSNATKNFSKMSQGMGGLLGFYANLAASLFAISAAFNFLKSAGDLKVLQASQQAYAANTGLAMRVLANDITAATKAQISFQDASQAAAIGTASGLNPQQLTQLSKAASDLSVTLGRDVTDSFNRLIRGVTKAEPELLDELGIVLRLKDAQEEYGAIINKRAENLTAFEKTQAVFNKTLMEANKVAAITPDIVNPYNQLAKAFDDILISIKRVADYVVGPLASVLTKTPELAILAFGLLLKGPLNAMGLNLKEIGATATTTSNRMAIEAQKAKAAYESSRLTIKATTAAVREQAAAIVAAGSQSKILQQFASGGVMTPQAVATLKRSLQAAEGHVNKHGIVVKGIFKGMSIDIVRSYALAMEQMELAEKAKVSGTMRATTTIKSLWATVGAGIARLGAGIVALASKLLGWASVLSIVYTAFKLLADQMGWFETSLSDSEKEIAATRDRLKELNVEFKDFLAQQRKLAGLGNSDKIAENVGKAFSMLDSSQFKTAIEDVDAYNKALEVIYARHEQRMTGKKVTFREAVERAFSAPSASTVRPGVSYEDSLADTKAGAEFIQTQLNSINEALDAAQAAGVGAAIPLLKMRELLSEPGKFAEMPEEIERRRLGLLQYQSTLSELPRLFSDSAAATSEWITSMSPMSQGQRTIQSLTAELSNYESKALATVGGEAGLSDDDRKRMTELRNSIEIIDKSEKRIHNTKLANLMLDQQQEMSLRNSSKEYTNVLNASYALQRTQLQVKERLDEITSLETDLVDLSGEENVANRRKIELLKAQNSLAAEQEASQLEEIVRLTSILSLDLQILDIKLNSDVNTKAKEYLDTLNQQVQNSKSLLDIEEKRANISLERAERDVDISSRFSFLREEQRQAEAAYQLELSLIGKKVTQITTEADIKKQMAKVDNILLDNRLRVLVLELRKQKLEKGISAEQIASLEAQAAIVESTRSGLSLTLSDTLELIDAQTLLSFDELFNSLEGLDQVRTDLEEINVILDNMAQTLFSEMSSALDSLITNTEGSLKDAALSVIENLARALSKSVSDLITTQILEVMTNKFGGVLDPLTNAANKGANQVASTLKDGSAAVATAIRSAFAEGAAAISAAAAGILGGTAKKESEGDFFENLVGIVAGEKTDTSPKGVPTVNSRQPLALQRQLPITNARKLGSMFMPKNLAGVVDTQARFGPASNAEKLGSMVGKSSATFGNAQPTQGMFSGLMNFMKTLFSPQNPVFKGLLGLFSSIVPLLGKILPFLGTILKGALSIFGFANGGMVKGGFRAYANGGVVTKPTLGLVGEGRYNEAIVPMPNGKAIPVDMKGAGQQNNVTVNVSVDSQGNASTNMQQDSAQAGNLGQVIARAVQQELQNQKRSGGILNPYGAA